MANSPVSDPQLARFIEAETQKQKFQVSIFMFSHSM